MKGIEYPKGKDFVFTVFDDTDVATLEYIRPVYDTLTELDIYTTKSVWPLRCHEKNAYQGSHTLEDAQYALYIRELQSRGFEIAFHGSTMVSGDRTTTIRSLELYHAILGRNPRVCAFHAYNRENLYWGSLRLSVRLLRFLYKVIFREKKDFYQGHREGSPYFWGDICKKHIDYVRNFTFDEINLLNIADKIMYRDEATPWVRNWFLTADADNVEEFNRLLCEENQEKLCSERGICIVSTHFGKGFIKNGSLHPETKRLLHLLSQRNGWFVPVSTVLDFIESRTSNNTLSGRERFILECKWCIHLVRRKLKSVKYEKTEIEYLAK